MPLAVLLALLPMPASAGQVDASGRWLEALLPPDPEQPEKGPGPWVSARDVELTPAEDAVRVRATWSIRTVEPGWVDLPLVDASVRVDRSVFAGQRVALKSLSDGRRHLVAWVDRPGELILEGEVEGDLRRGLSLEMLPAAVGTVRVRTPDPVVDVTVGGAPTIELDGRFWTASESFEVLSSPEEARERGDQLVVAAVGLGVTVGDGDLRARGRIRWTVARGELESVSFRASGAGPDLAVTGPSVAEWTRSGDQVFVQLRRPEKAGAEVEVSWSTALPSGDEATIGLPSLEPEGVFRVERGLQIARDGDREIVPRLSGFAATSATELPPVARDLVVGTPMSAWVGSGGAGSLQLLRFTPVSGPPTIVDVASYDGALSADGRLILRAHYSIRNDRGAFLRVTLPPDAMVVGARLGGEPTSIARDGEVWLVPLLKSVETVQGLLSFPVDLVIIQDGNPFLDKDERPLPLPVLDAEVAVTRVELSLPVGWRDRLEPGEHERVADFSEGAGITYGFSTGEAEKVAEADKLFQDALDGWMANDFDRAQDALEDLRSLGASNENIERLQSNLDLVLVPQSAPGSGGAEVALQRRVKEQAFARAAKDQEAQQQLMEEADEAYYSGDYAKAEASYKQALEIGSNLERLEQEESVEQKASNMKLKEKLAKTAEEGKKKADSGYVEIDLADEEEDLTIQFGRDRPIDGDERDYDPPEESIGYGEAGGFLAGGEVPAGEEPGRYTTRTEIDFEDIPVEGILVKPQAELVIDGRASPPEAGFDQAEPSPVVTGDYELAQPADDGGYARPDRARNGGGGGGLGAKKAAAPPPPPPPPPPAAPMPPKAAPAKDFKGGRKVTSVPLSSGPHSDPEPMAPPEPPPPVEIERFAALEVTAASLDVVIPAFGDTVRYQHLLLPAGQAHAVLLRVKKKRGAP